MIRPPALTTISTMFTALLAPFALAGLTAVAPAPAAEDGVVAMGRERR